MQLLGVETEHLELRDRLNKWIMMMMEHHPCLSLVPVVVKHVLVHQGLKQKSSRDSL